jgi:hypothetical protein
MKFIFYFLFFIFYQSTAFCQFFSKKNEGEVILFAVDTILKNTFNNLLFKSSANKNRDSLLDKQVNEEYGFRIILNNYKSKSKSTYNSYLYIGKYRFPYCIVKNNQFFFDLNQGNFFDIIVWCLQKKNKKYKITYTMGFKGYNKLRGFGYTFYGYVMEISSMPFGKFKILSNNPFWEQY